MVFANAVTLGIEDPCGNKCENLICVILENSEHFFFAYFFLEMLIKLYAMGLTGKNSYLSDAGNAFDFSIVVVGSVEYIFLNQTYNLQAIRSLRMLRTLRAMTRISSLRLLTTLILDTLPMLGNVLVFIIFLFFVFGIIAINLWAGILRQRCYFPPGLKRPDFMPEYYHLSDDEYICSPIFGMRKCDQILLFEEHSSMCVELFAGDAEKLDTCYHTISNYSDCRPDAENPGSGNTHFDNIFHAFVTIFQVISLEGWVDVMYYVQDAFSFWAFIYFFLLVLLGSYFAVKLCLVVIAAQFSLFKHDPSRHSLYLQLLDLFQCIAMRILKLFQPKVKTQVIQQLVLVTKQETDNFALSGAAIRENSIYKSIFLSKIANVISTSQKRVANFLETTTASVVTALLIITNSVIMMLEHYNQPPELSIFIESANVFFTIVFAVEVAIRFYGRGLFGFFREPFNLMDLAISLINAYEIIYLNNSSFTVLRSFRLLRLVKLIRYLPGLQKQLLLMLRTFDNAIAFFFLLGFVIYVSALFGRSFFSCRSCTIEGDVSTNASQPELTTCQNCTNRQMMVSYAREKPDQEQTCADPKFNSLFHSIITVLQVFTRDNWADIMLDRMQTSGQWTALYFIVLVTIGDYIVFNILIGVLVEGFGVEQETQLEEQMRLESHDPRPHLRRNALHWIQEKASFFASATYYLNGASSRASLFVFTPTSTIRRASRKIVASQYWDLTFLVVVVVSCIIIIWERPNISRGEVIATSILFCLTTFAFFVEAALKIIAQGFLFDKNAYLRSWWNVIDFVLLIFGIIDIATSAVNAQTSNRVLLKILRPVRLLRALRPLRLISRAYRLRMLLETLAKSVKPIGEIVLICLFFFTIFAIFGVQLFKGCFAHCAIPDSYGHMVHDDVVSQSSVLNFSQVDLEERVENVTTRSECEKFGLAWKTHSYNFDSFPLALMTLFVFATLDGWMEITQNGVDCVAPDVTPVHGYNLWAYLYFFFYLFVVCFFALNMFVGVVVNNFQKVAQRIAIEAKLAKRVSDVGVLLRYFEKKFQGRQNFCFSRARQRSRDENFLDTYPKWRRTLYRLVTHAAFEYGIMFAVCLNVLCMAMEHDKIDRTMAFWLNVAGNIFFALLTLEMVLKIIAMGVWRYLKDKWNILDIVVNVSSLAGVVLENMGDDLVPINPSVIRVARIFRIIRILKLIKTARGMRALLETITATLPKIMDLSVLFLLLFFIYGSLGVQLYGHYDCAYESCAGLSRHANFDDFGMALLTLFRIFTGDNWHPVLQDILDMSKSPDFCQLSSSETDGPQTSKIPCSFVIAIAPLYFVSFLLLSQFILINIVVAVLMQQIEVLQQKGLSDKEGEVLNNEPSVIDTVKSIEDSINTSNQLDQLSIPRLSGFSQQEVVSFVSADYVLRQQICDAAYLRFRLRQLANDELPTSRPGGFLRESQSLNSDMITFAEMLQFAAWRTGRRSSMVTCDRQLWLQLAREIQRDFIISCRRSSIVNYVSVRSRQVSQASSDLTWSLDDSRSVLESPCISENLFEFSSSHFDTNSATQDCDK